MAEPNELEAWREVHSTLLKACELAQDSVDAKRMQYRFWLEEIASNLTVEGRLHFMSVWKQPNAKPRIIKRKAQPTVAAAATKRKRKSSATGATSAAAAAASKSKAKSSAAAEGLEEDGKPKPKKIKISLKKSDHGAPPARKHAPLKKRIPAPPQPSVSADETTSHTMMAAPQDPPSNYQQQLELELQQQAIASSNLPMGAASAAAVLPQAVDMGAQALYAQQTLAAAAAAPPSVQSSYQNQPLGGDPSAIAAAQQQQQPLSLEATQSPLQMMAAVAFGAASTGTGMQQPLQQQQQQTPQAQHGMLYDNTAEDAYRQSLLRRASAATVAYGSIQDVVDDEEEDEDEDDPF